MPELNIDSGPDWSDALGAGTTALAALADLGFNKGRGTGNILAAGGQFAQARGEQRLAQTKEALNYEEKRAALDRSNRHDDYLYANMAQRGQQGAVKLDQAGQRIEIAGQNAGTKAKGEARQTRKEDRDTNPESDYRDAFADTLIKQGMATSAELKNLSYEQMKADYGAQARKFDLEHAGEKAGNAATGRINAENALAGETGAAKATEYGAQTPGAVDRARQTAAATAPYKVDVAEDSAAARVRGQQAGERQVGGGIRVPGLVPTDPEVAAQNAGDPATLAKIQAIGGPLASARDALKEMIAIRKQYGTELPGNAKSRFDMAQVAINGAMTKIGETGVLSNEERNYYMSMIPSLTLGWTDALRPGGKDIKAEQLAGAAQEFGNLANGKLRAYGWGLDSGAPQQAAPMPGAPPPQVGPGQFDVPGNLGVMGTRNDRTGAAPIPGSATDEVMMQSPRGVTGPVPRDKVQKAIASGWKVVQ
jgi:hypothetical protein